jgi:peptidoglycan hydrolase-like protein with peptidoglycan-binding domain
VASSYELVLLKQGTHGDAVKKLQEKLAIGADGQFGSGTEKAVRDYQQKNGLVIDGMAGPATLAHMKLFKEITADTVKASEGKAGLRSIWDTIKGAFT